MNYFGMPTSVAAGAAGGTVLLGVGSMWFVLAGLTMIMLALALVRLVPRSEV